MCSCERIFRRQQKLYAHDVRLNLVHEKRYFGRKTRARKAIPGNNIRRIICVGTTVTTEEHLYVLAKK